MKQACFYVGWFVLCLALVHRVAIGAWLNARAARKSLRLLNAVAYWAAEREMCE